MTHKAGEGFFAHKRAWSKRKDEILGCYLTAYLPKIMTLGRPVLIVDGFAGPGKFGDGQDGSPLIICDCIHQTNRKNLQSPQTVELLCIEKTPGLYSSLESNLGRVGFATARFGEFSEFSDDIARATRTCSVFLYVDPFTVEGLVWDELITIYQGLHEGGSVEILLNLNASSFVRRGLSAMKTELAEMEHDDDHDGPVDLELPESPQIEALDRVAGGSWWQDLVREKKPFPQTVEEFVKSYCERMKPWFSQVVYHPVKAAPSHTVAKYYLVFGTRHIDGLALMNDEMVKSRRALADLAKPKVPMLFETRSEELVPDVDCLPDIILDTTQSPIKRGDAIKLVIQQHFCQFHWTEIRGCIESMLKSKRLESDTGKVRINDDVKIWSSE